MLATAYPYVKKMPGIKKLFNRSVAPAHSPEALPKQIYFFWDKGLENAPDIVKICAESWQKKNPGWTFIHLDQAAANQILDRDALPKELFLVAYTDMLRTEILATRGGVWADATLYCVAPLDQWLLPLFNQTDFFAFHRPAPDRLVSSWFLASTNRSILINVWSKQAHRFWRQKPKFYAPYFWLHFTFEYLVHMKRSARKSWAHVPRLSAGPCHILSDAHNAGGVDDDARHRASHSYVQKLTLRTDMSPDIVEGL